MKIKGEKELEKILYKALPRHQSLIKEIYCDNSNTKCTWSTAHHSKESPSKEQSPGTKKVSFFLHRGKQK